MIINTNKNLAQTLLDRAIVKFRGAYKVPTFPKVKKILSDSVTYDWKELKATFTLKVSSNNGYSGYNFMITANVLSQAFQCPSLPYHSDDELVDLITQTLEYWVNNCMGG